MARIVEWDGQHVPAEMRSLPPGRYVLESVDAAPTLTAEQEAGLDEAIGAADAGEDGVSLAEARAELRSILKR